MSFIKRNIRVFIVIAALLIPLFSFFSFYFTSNYKHLKELEVEIANAREERERVLTENVASLGE